MREIKFRAWNKRIGWKDRHGLDYKPIMEYDRFVIYPETGLCEFLVGGWELFGKTENSDNFILMQDTGFKDKNRASIFEGYIVKTNTDNIVSVEYDNYYGAYLFGGFRTTQDEIYKLGIEVIGNIYENPELLDKD
jgi:uncharacterized phage protein (TIGR01671 family)